MVDVHTLIMLEPPVSVGNKLDAGRQHPGRCPSRVGYNHCSTRRSITITSVSGKCYRRPITCLRSLTRTSMYLYTSYSSIKVFRKEPHISAGLNRPAPQGASSDCSGTLYRENTVEGKSSKITLIGLLNATRSN